MTDNNHKQETIDRLAQTHDLLVQGLFQGHLVDQVVECRKYLAKLVTEMRSQVETQEQVPSEKEA